jgi:hypothetical protein
MDDVRVEVVYSRAEDQLQSGLRTIAMEHVNGYPDGGYHFKARFVPEMSGHLVYGVRAYAFNELLASPFDAQSIRWA